MINIDISKKLQSSIGNMELNIKLNIKKYDFIALSGVSGSGKSTLLRILAGLEKCNGKIEVDGEIWIDENFTLPPQKRHIGFVFQDYALFENMSVIENLLYVTKDNVLASRLLNITNLESLKHRLPNTLSGGQKQRVSLCRAMMSRPKLLLMDEPLSALDPKMRVKLQNEILILHREFKTTTIMVSHDPSEIYRLSNRVLVLEYGKIIDDGLAKDIFLKRSGSQKFSFIGELLNIIKVDVIYIAVIAIDTQIVEVAISKNEATILRVGQKLRVGTKAFGVNLALL